VPYACGALDNHPGKGFHLKTLGTAVAYLATGMTTRQGMQFFAGLMIKTVDDRRGYAFPWDPFQHLTSKMWSTTTCTTSSEASRGISGRPGLHFGIECLGRCGRQRTRWHVKGPIELRRRISDVDVMLAHTQVGRNPRTCCRSPASRRVAASLAQFLGHTADR
jgi:hypothetical protein